MPLRFALIDAPSPLGVGPTGGERLAEALRAAGLKEALNAEDGGAVRVPPHDPRRDPDTLLLNPVAIGDFSQRLADALGEVLDRGRFPVVLGGDCNVLIGDMLALCRRGRYGLFFLDGHADFYQPEASRLLGYGKVAGFWIHLDADVLDEAAMPAVDYRLPGGLSFAELSVILRTLVASGEAVGVEITVFNPALDPDGSIAHRFVQSIAEGLAMGQGQSARPADRPL